MAARIDRAGCYDALVEPVASPSERFYAEFFDWEPGADRDAVVAHFDDRTGRHDEAELCLLADRIGHLGPDPARPRRLVAAGLGGARPASRATRPAGRCGPPRRASTRCSARRRCDAARARRRHAVLARAAGGGRDRPRRSGRRGAAGGRSVRTDQPAPRAGAGISTAFTGPSGELAEDGGLMLLASGDFLGEGRNGRPGRKSAWGRIEGWLARAVALGSPILRVVSGFYRAELLGRPDLVRRSSGTTSSRCFATRSARGRRRGDASAREPLRLHRLRVPRDRGGGSGRARSASSST